MQVIKSLIHSRYFLIQFSLLHGYTKADIFIVMFTKQTLYSKTCSSLHIQPQRDGADGNQSNMSSVPTFGMYSLNK